MMTIFPPTIPLGWLKIGMVTTRSGAFFCLMVVVILALVGHLVSEGKVCGNFFIFSYFLSKDTLLLWNVMGDWCDGNMNVPTGQCMIVRLLYFLVSLFQ